ncbi:LysM peptidoglycan-binding domain-containing protein [Streptomyces niveus]|uniref:LysM peptidoglycan-binding domain-containing protein n=1 Tax=Streptomyces niveus TaxID=193462 RepID=UPI0037A779A4
MCRVHGWNAPSVSGHLECQTAPKPPTVVTYTVKEGDSLWGIAASKIGGGARYPGVAKLNKLKDAHEITPGQKLKLPSL